MRILPSATTVLAICAGLTSIKFALDGRPHVALALIGAAAVLDGIDGGIARALDAQSRMGAEIDSLADAVNFGVAPALVIYVTLLPTSPVGWIFVLLYAVCIVLRLARFNALLDDDTQPAYTRRVLRRHARAVRARSASIGLLAAMLQFGDGWWTSPWFVCVWLAANSAAAGQPGADAGAASRCGAAERRPDPADRCGGRRGGRDCCCSPTSWCC